MKVTLSDIARHVGVTPSTVQRALNGLDGVGSDKRDLIRRVAEEMGYRRNLTAAALKTGTRTLGIVLPEPIHNNRFYAKFLWDGALACGESYREFNLTFAEFTYVRTPENHVAKLLEVARDHADGLDGLLTMGVDAPGAETAFAAFRERGVPVVLVGTDARPADRLCCVRTYDEMAGRMAADLLVTFAAPQRRATVVMTGDFAIPDQFYNAQGFEHRLYESGLPFRVLKLANDPDLEAVRRNVAAALADDPSVAAVYATSSRNTVPMCRAAAACGRRVHVLGSDIFPESIDFLREGTLSALIHKRPRDQAHEAMRLLVNAVAKGEAAPRDTVRIEPALVMKSNLECYIGDGGTGAPTPA